MTALDQPDGVDLTAAALQEIEAHEPAPMRQRLYRLAPKQRVKDSSLEPCSLQRDQAHARRTLAQIERRCIFSPALTDCPPLVGHGPRAPAAQL